MKYYLLSLCFFAGLQAISGLEDLKKKITADIKAELQKQDIKDKNTLYKQKISTLGLKSEQQVKSGRYRYNPLYDHHHEMYMPIYDTHYVFGDNSVLIEPEDDQGAVYKDVRGNKIVFDRQGKIVQIEPSLDNMLSYAIKANNVATVQELINQGVEVTDEHVILASQKTYGPNPLVLKMLMATAYASSQEPLFKAIEAGDIAQVHSIITKNPGALFQVDSRGRRPFDAALTKAAYARGCLLGTTKATAPEVAGSTNMVLMLLDTAGVQQDVTLLHDRVRHMLVRCPELTKELIARTKNTRFIEEVQKLVPA